MSELRQDPTTLGWVLVAPERAHRPGEHGASAARPEANSDGCPLCPGHETELRRRCGGSLPRPAAGASASCPNRFPLLGTDEGLLAGSDGFRALGGRGRHEVVVESVDHSWDMALGTPDEIRHVLDAYRVRYHALRRRGAELVVVFRNHGAASGTSLEHPHSQVVGTPVVPRLVRSRIEVARQRYDDAGSCLYLEVLERELPPGAAS